MVIASAALEDRAELLDSPLDALELERSRSRRAQFDRNWAWFQTQIDELAKQYFGKFVCIAGQHAFAKDSSKEACQAAAAAYPEDRGRFVHYFPRHRLPRINAHIR
jgi:hypothetical protein